MPPPACRGRCTQPCSASLDLPHPSPAAPSTLLRPLPRFFLREEGGLNFSSTAARAHHLLRQRAPDEVLPVDVAQHFFELPLVDALRSHAQRVSAAEEAELEVLGVMPFTSWVIDNLACAPLCDGSNAHRARMAAAAATLHQIHEWGHSRQTGRRFLLIVGHYSIYRSLGEELTAELERGNVLMAVADTSFGTQKTLRGLGKGALPNLIMTGIVLPYWAHSHAVYPDEITHGSAFGAHAAVAGPPRRRGIMFHGGLLRFDFGVRNRMVEIMRILGAQRVPIDLRLSELTRAVGNGTKLDERAGGRRAQYTESGHAFLNASLCPSPSGDTLTSRRLFDAMSGGCVPVLMRSMFGLRMLSGPSKGDLYAALPFPLSVDWQSVTLCLLPSPLSKGSCIGGDAAWLRGWHDEEAALESMRRSALEVFRSHLDYTRNPQGVASAVLREAAARIGRPSLLGRAGSARGFGAGQMKPSSVHGKR